MLRTIELEHRYSRVSGKVAKIIRELILQNDELQRPAHARPSLLSASPEQGETTSILSELDTARGKTPPAGSRARRPRKGLMAGTVLVLAAMGGTAVLAMRDISSSTQLAQVAQSGQAVDQATAPAPVVAGSDQHAAAYVKQLGAAEQAAAPSPSGAAEASLPAEAAVAGAAVLTAALAAPPVEKAADTAATIIDAPAPVPVSAPVVKPAPAPVHKAVVKERKAASAKRKERHTRVAKASVPVKKAVKEKAPGSPPQAAPDNDAELLAALVAHTRPPQASSCSQSGGKSAGSAACGGAPKR